MSYPQWCRKTLIAGGQSKSQVQEGLGEERKGEEGQEEQVPHSQQLWFRVHVERVWFERIGPSQECMAWPGEGAQGETWLHSDLPHYQCGPSAHRKCAVLKLWNILFLVRSTSTSIKMWTYRSGNHFCRYWGCFKEAERSFVFRRVHFRFIYAHVYQHTLHI